MNIGPCVFFGGVKWSLVSMMVITSHDLLAADLVFEDLCLVSKHHSSNPQDPEDQLSSTGMWDQENVLCRSFTEIRSK